MSALQLWIVVGVPVLVAVLVLLVGGDVRRSRFALLLIVSLAVVFVVAPGAGGASVAVLALPAIILVASGRLEGPSAVPHHASRRRLTTASGE
jgi:hypothetical protein